MGLIPRRRRRILPHARSPDWAKPASWAGDGLRGKHAEREECGDDRGDQDETSRDVEQTEGSVFGKHVWMCPWMKESRCDEDPILPDGPRAPVPGFVGTRTRDTSEFGLRISDPRA